MTPSKPTLKVGRGTADANGNGATRRIRVGNAEIGGDRPLIIAGPAEDNTALYAKIDKLIPHLTPQTETDGPGDYTPDEKSKQVHLTEEGHAHVEELMAKARDLGAPYDLVVAVHESGRLPVPNFAAGGVATPPDAALCRLLGAEAVFVGSGIFKSDDPAPRAKAIVEATTNYRDPDILVKVSRGLGDAMPGIEIDQIETPFADRGW